MERAVIYARKSDPNATADDESFENQEDACRAYAAEKGYQVVKVIRESHSGADLLNRPLIWEAIEDIQSGHASVLLVRNYDRLARKVEHQGVILYEVEDKGKGHVEAALDPVDRQDPTARMTRAILAAVADGERQHAVARMERGKLRRVQRGELPAMSGPKYGYCWLDDEKDQRTAFAPDPQTAPVVQRIFDLAKTGSISTRRIALLLNEEGVPTRSQVSAAAGHRGRHRVGTHWSADAVLHILRDRAYLGEYRTMGGATVAVPALVDEQTWNAVQHVLDQRELVGRPPIDAGAAWLRRHVYCGVCHYRMGQFRRRAPDEQHETYVYACRRKKGSSTNGEDCPAGAFGIRSHLLDPYAYEALAKMVGMPEPYPLRSLLIKRLGLDREQALAAMAEGYAAQLAEKRALLETARRRAVQTTDDDLAAQFLADAEALNHDLRTLEVEYAEARGALDEFSSGYAWIDATLDRIHTALPMPNPTPDDIRAMPLDVRRLLLDLTGVQLEVYPVGWRTDGRRVVTHFEWEKSLPSRDGSIRLFVTLDDLLSA